MATVASTKRQQTHTSNTYESDSTVTVGTNIVMNTSCTVDGRDVSADGVKLDGIACGATACTGTVSNLGNLGITATATELNYTTNVTSDIQAQLNGKSPTAGSTSLTTLGNIVTGTWQGTDIADAYIASASTWNNNTSCCGTVRCVNTGTGLTGGAITETGTISIDSTCNACWNAKTSCCGTVRCVNTGTGLIGGAITDTGTISIDSTCNACWNAKTSCCGTVRCVNTGTGLTGGAITETGTISINSTCNARWNANTTCTGTVTSVTGGDGLTGTVTSSGSLAVDSTVVRTTGAQTIAGVKNFTDYICSNAIIHTGDADTCIQFNTDSICFHAQGECQMLINTSGVVINEPGNSTDFRVESDTNTHMLFVDGSANAIGINCSTPGATLAVNGSFTATCKSFLIDNPVTGGQLKYGVVEGNEHGVTVRGSTCSGTIELPDEWDWLVHEDSVTAQLIPVGSAHTPYVISQDNKRVVVCAEGCYNYNIYGTRKDVEPLEVNIL